MAPLTTILLNITILTATLLTIPTLASAKLSNVVHEPHYHADKDHFFNLLKAGRIKTVQVGSVGGDGVETEQQIIHTAEDELVTGPHFVDLPIDHSDKEKGTFKNRYWAYDKFYKKGGPVILFDVGESDASQFTTFPSTETSLAHILGKELGGIILVWEHRYYGESLPYTVGPETNSEQWQYLTIDQALADIPYFAKQFSHPDHKDVDLTPSSTPWIMIGGSYPGNRVAWARLKYPETIYAGHSSSGPTQVKVDFREYFYTIWRSMNDLGYKNCTSNINAALIEIDKSLQTPKEAAKIKQLFFGRGAEKNTHFSFTYALEQVFYNFQAWSMTPEMADASGNFIKNPLVDLCDWMSYDEKAGKYAPAEGWDETKGGRYLVERWASWAARPMLGGCEGHVNPPPPETQAPPAICDLSYSLQGQTPSTYSWTWQFCSEFGYLQTGSPGQHRLVSKYNNMQMELEFCHRAFPDAVENGIMKYLPKAKEVNQKYGGWNSRPSNVFFTAGEHDPWTALSHLSHENGSPRKRGVKIQHEVIPECGKSSQGEIFGYEMSNEVHCGELWGIGAEAVKTIEISVTAMKKWLPCFKGGNKSGTSNDGHLKDGGDSSDKQLESEDAEVDEVGGEGIPAPPEASDYTDDEEEDNYYELPPLPQKAHHSKPRPPHYRPDDESDYYRGRPGRGSYQGSDRPKWYGGYRDHQRKPRPKKHHRRPRPSRPTRGGHPGYDSVYDRPRGGR